MGNHKHFTKNKNVEWKDLRKLSKKQVMFNMVLPYPFLVAAWFTTFNQYYVLASIFFYFFFTASFRQAHDAYHRTLGIKNKNLKYVLHALSFLLLTSTHAVRETHLHHHKAPLDESDIETRFYKLSWYKAVLGGFSHWWSLQVEGYKMAKDHNKPSIVKDYVLMLSMVLLSVGVFVLFDSSFLLLHCVIMLIANMLVGFVAGWCVHRGCDPEEIIARTERNPIINALTLNMLYHQEHHLYPSVPANHLPILAQRLDDKAPQMTELHVVSFDTAKVKENNCPLRKRFKY